MSDDPDVLIMTNEICPDLHAIGIVDNAEMWHSDASHRAEPCQAILLHATRNPSQGGDTEFCDLRAVYDALAPDLKAELAGRNAVHHWSKSRNPRFAGTLDPAGFEEGERIARVTVNRPDLRRPFPPSLVQALTGARVTTLSRRAKYGLIHTDRDQTMIFHLGMSGRWRNQPDMLQKHDHLVLETAAGHVLALNDARRFGSVDLVDSAALDAWPPFAALGPEPLGDGLNPAHLALASGDLVSAESALAAAGEMAPTIADPDLDAGIQLGRVCLAYLQGWKDSARDSLRGIEPTLQRARWRSRLVLPLISLTIEARRQERTEDMIAFGKLAVALAAKGGTQAELAAHVADPGYDISGIARAYEVRNLLSEGVKA